MKTNWIKSAVIGVAVCAIGANAQVGFKGIGWDNNAQELTGRIGLGGFNNIEVGAGFRWAESPSGATVAQEDVASMLSFSLRYMLALHEWEKLTGYLTLGGHFQDDAGPGRRAASFNVLAAYEPEVVLLQHFAVSTRFGLQYTIAPDMAVGLMGEPVSIVSGLNFHILF